MPATGRVLNIEEVITPDNLGKEITRIYQTWSSFHQLKKNDWTELYKYIYATDTRTTTNNQLPWKNTTTTPKLTQIRDNLYANYMASMFPKSRWMHWEGADQQDETKDKVAAIESYMQYCIEYPGFKETIAQLVLDYIDTGNAFATVDWLDQRVDTGAKVQEGYVGPVVVRISPWDIVMNPAAPTFVSTPKIIRSLVSLGEVKELLERLTPSEEFATSGAELFDYMKTIRLRMSSMQGDISGPDQEYMVDGFTSFQAYLASGYAEILTFYGDMYDSVNDKFWKNRIIQVVDRHKVIRNDPNPSDLGMPSIYHSGWRPRTDNLWAMGPLDNLVGLQYRLDHIENLKADFFDLVAFPPLKIKGYVEDFQWGPFEKIYVGDEGDVEPLISNINPLQANMELQQLMATMEEMAGAPKEAMGFRTPGEKTAYEVEQLQNAAGRIFQAKISQFEENLIEPILNAMLELARRRMDSTTIRVLDNQYNIALFMSLTADDIQGAGRFRSVSARHFAEVANVVQNVTQFYSSGIGADPEVRTHISSIELAKLFEELLDLSNYELVTPFIRLTEQAEAQQMAQQHQEDTMMMSQTPSGLTPDDADQSFLGPPINGGNSANQSAPNSVGQAPAGR